jgi:hypothetical protein
MFDITTATDGEILYRIASLRLGLDCTTDTGRHEMYTAMIQELEEELKIRGSVRTK